MNQNFRGFFLNLGFGDSRVGMWFRLRSSVEGHCFFRLRIKLVTLIIFSFIVCVDFLLIVYKMTNDNSSPSKLATGCSTSSRSVFHEDDYTHPCHPFYVHPSNVLGSSLVSVPFDGTGMGVRDELFL